MIPNFVTAMGRLMFVELHSRYNSAARVLNSLRTYETSRKPIHVTSRSILIDSSKLTLVQYSSMFGHGCHQELHVGNTARKVPW